MLAAEELKKIASNAIDNASSDLNQISQDIWNHPELNFEEKYAHKTLTDFLERYGFPMERHYVVDTGFRSQVGVSQHPNIAVLCEFDALPDIGHACGHNLIAEAGAAAAIGIKAALDAAKANGHDLGKLTVFGTPAEEGGGGKIDFVRAGAFDIIDVAMMVHPNQFDAVPCFEIALTVLGTPAEEGGGGKVYFTEAGAFDTIDCAQMVHPFGYSIVSAVILARESVKIKFLGKASHAAGFPWEGINALDAAVMAYTSVSVMRQQMKPDWRVHGVILNGGAKPNIIPEETELEYYIRAPSVRELQILKDKFTQCFQAAALATGCSVEFDWGDKPYDNVICNKSMATLFEKNLKTMQPDFGKDVSEERMRQAAGSTDMGNVSYVVPSIHPFYGIGSDAVNHTRAFTAAAGDPKAQSYTLNQAKAMAMTAIDIYCQPDLVQQMHDELKQQLEQLK